MRPSAPCLPAMSMRVTVTASRWSPAPAMRDDSADIGRASERLMQQARGSIDSVIDTGQQQQARARVAQLQLDIARDPQKVVGAFGRLTQNAFSAAIAEPSD